VTPAGGRGKRPTVFCDTSVLVAAMYQPHQQHVRSRAVVEGLAAKQGACALHSLAECYAVLTRMPGPGPTPAPADVQGAVELVRASFTVIPLTADDYASVLADLASRGLVGALVYDALILRCAAIARASVVYTWNERHFQRVAPALADRIRTPS
jgi:predicted nucleic acid-binding protein